MIGLLYYSVQNILNGFHSEKSRYEKEKDGKEKEEEEEAESQTE
jgi:hypothetical protein